jgi:hypothetical protein
LLDVRVISVGLIAVVPVIALRCYGRLLRGWLSASLLNVHWGLSRYCNHRRIVWIGVVVIRERVIVIRVRYAKIEPHTHMAMTICLRNPTDGDSSQHY